MNTIKITLGGSLLLAFSAQLSGQQSMAGYIPPDRGYGNVEEDTFGGAPHTLFDRHERALQREAAQKLSSTRTFSSGTVSVDELRHPLKGKSLEIIENGQRYAKAGDHLNAISEFKKALSDPAAVGYANSLLGSEYLKTGNPTAAIASLSEAVRLMPHLAVNHSNLGYAFLATGNPEQAERELREAIKLDKVAPQSRFLLGLVLLDRRSEEAGRYLSFAQKIIKTARLASAIFHFRHGDSAAAEQDLREYLGLQWIEEAAVTLRWASAAARMEQPSQLFGFPAENHGQ